MASALSIGNELSPSRMISKSDESQVKMKKGIDLSIENSKQNESSRNLITVGKPSTSDSNQPDNISKATKRTLSGGRPTSLESSENQDKSFQDVSNKKNFEEIKIDIKQKKNSQSQNSENLGLQENNDQQYRGSFKSQNERPNDAFSIQAS